MERYRSLVLVASVLVPTLGQAANRFFIDPQTLPCGATGVTVPVLADVDQDTYGLSVSIEFDRTKVQVTGFEPGAAVTAVDPEWITDGDDPVVDNTAGRLFYGVVFDLSGPTIDKHMNPGANLEILRLTVDIIASSPTTATLDLRDVSGAPARLNVMTDENGDSVSPLALVDGDLSCRDLSAQVTQVCNVGSSCSGSSTATGSSQSDTDITIKGENLNQPGLTVKVGGVLVPAGDVNVISATELEATVGGCSQGTLAVEVCNDYGCDVKANAFECTGPPVPVIVEFLNDRFQSGTVTGPAGTIFHVVGQNFNEPGLEVRVCGQVIGDATLLADDQTIRLSSPVCAQTGCVTVEVCNTWGCDDRDDGFCYPGAPIIETYPLGSSGEPGDTLWIVGQNFDQPGLLARIGGTDATDVQILPDGTLQLTVPPCPGENPGPADVEVCTDIGCDTDEGGFTYTACFSGTPFLRGDTNNSGNVDLSDAVATFNALFLGIPALAPCRDALDANDSGSVDLSDGIYVLEFLFQGGPRIPVPYPDAGLDPTPDNLPGC